MTTQGASGVRPPPTAAVGGAGPPSSSSTAGTRLGVGVGGGRGGRGGAAAQTLISPSTGRGAVARPSPPARASPLARGSALLGRAAAAAAPPAAPAAVVALAPAPADPAAALPPSPGAACLSADPADAAPPRRGAAPPAVVVAAGAAARDPRVAADAREAMADALLGPVPVERSPSPLPAAAAPGAPAPLPEVPAALKAGFRRWLARARSSPRSPQPPSDDAARLRVAEQQLAELQSRLRSEVATARVEALAEAVNGNWDTPEIRRLGKALRELEHQRASEAQQAEADHAAVAAKAAAATSRAEALEDALRTARAAHAKTKAALHRFQEESASLQRQVKALEARPVTVPAAASEQQVAAGRLLRQGHRAELVEVRDEAARTVAAAEERCRGLVAAAEARCREQVARARRDALASAVPLPAPASPLVSVQPSATPPLSAAQQERAATHAALQPGAEPTGTHTRFGRKQGRASRRRAAAPPAAPPPVSPPSKARPAVSQDFPTAYAAWKLRRDEVARMPAGPSRDSAYRRLRKAAPRAAPAAGASAPLPAGDDDSPPPARPPRPRATSRGKRLGSAAAGSPGTSSPLPGSSRPVPAPARDEAGAAAVPPASAPLLPAGPSPAPVRPQLPPAPTTLPPLVVGPPPWGAAPPGAYMYASPPYGAPWGGGMLQDPQALAHLIACAVQQAFAQAASLPPPFVGGAGWPPGGGVRA
jgi:hypothetical protein